MTDTDRIAYTQGLRALADLIDNNPDLPLPYSGSDATAPITFYVLNRTEDPKGTLAKIARLLPGAVGKSVSMTGEYFSITGTLAGLHIDATAYRNAVCERVVTGTREVTVPAIPAMPARPAIGEITTTVEDVEWVCGPLLAEDEPTPYVPREESDEDAERDAERLRNWS